MTDGFIFFIGVGIWTCALQLVIVNKVLTEIRDAMND